MLYNAIATCMDLTLKITRPCELNVADIFCRTSDENVTQIKYGDDQPVWTAAPVLMVPASTDKPKKLAVSVFKLFC